MRKLILAASLLWMSSTTLNAQSLTDGKKVKKDWSKVNIGDRANDHLMIQLGAEGWDGTPDSINTRGLGKHLNIYFMVDMPWKTNPRWSVAIGAGIGSSNIFFEKTDIDLIGERSSNKASFLNVTSGNYYKKYKLTTVWAEAPVELRWVSNPLNTNKSWKIAFGAKVGSMIAGYTKGKNLLNASGNTVYGTKYIAKEKDRKFLNGTRIAGTVRVGYGAISLYGAYQVGNLFKDTQGPEVRPYSIGISFSGL